MAERRSGSGAQGRSSKPVLRPPTFRAQGGYFTVRRRSAGFVLDYVSGELQGRERPLAIVEAEAGAIRTGGDAVVCYILRDQGVG